MRVNNPLKYAARKEFENNYIISLKNKNQHSSYILDLANKYESKFNEVIEIDFCNPPNFYYESK